MGNGQGNIVLKDCSIVPKPFVMKSQNTSFFPCCLSSERLGNDEFFYRMVCQRVSSCSHFQKYIITNKEAETKDIIKTSEKLVILYDTKNEDTKWVTRSPLEWITAGYKGWKITVQHGEGCIVEASIFITVYSKRRKEPLLKANVLLQGNIDNS